MNVKSEYVRKSIVYASIWYVRIWCDVIADVTHIFRLKIASYPLSVHSEVSLEVMAKAKAADAAPAMKKGRRRAMKARKAMK